MPQEISDNLGRARFDWPEPLVIDLIRDHYRDTVGAGERVTLARLQSRALCDRFEGASRRAAATTLELIAFCVARGIGPERIAATDRAVARELNALVEARFRTSPRLRSELLAAIDGVLPAEAAAPKRVPAPSRPAPRARILPVAACAA